MHTTRALALTFGLVLGAASPARADDISDFSKALKDSTGEGYPSLILEKLHTFKLGSACWTKVSTKGSGAIHLASFVTRDLKEYAAKLTKDDWDAIEEQGGDKAKNLALVAPMIDAFKSRLMVNIAVEGEDCDASQNALWLRYWSNAIEAVTKYPIPQEKIVINVIASAKQRDVTVVRSKDGSTFTITGPKDIAAKGAEETIQRPFRQLNAGIADDFAFSVKESTGDYNAAWVLTKFHTFKVGKKCLAKLGAKEGRPVHAAGFVTRDIVAYAKAVGADDWDEIEGQSSGDPANNRAIVSKSMDDFAKQLHITVAVEGDDCDTEQNALWIKYWSAIAAALEDHPPKAKQVTITLTVSAKAKDVTASASKDGSTFTFTAPRDKEPAGWSDKIEAPFEKVARTKR